MTHLSVMQLMNAHRIFLPGEDGIAHMVNVVEQAGTYGVLPELQRMLNYIAPRPDETILMFRDGRSEELCFFWQQITREEHGAALKACGVDIEHVKDWIPVRTNYRGPVRHCYHGGLICRNIGKPTMTWSVHT